jgi:hypothetical protein
MARDGQRKGKGCLITLVVLVLLAAGIWFVGLPIANNKAEDVVDAAVRNAMDSPGMPRVGYRDIQIDATRGQVDIYDLSVPLEEGSSLHAGRIRVTVAPSELVIFGLGRTSGLSKADIDIEQFTYKATDTVVAFDVMQISLDGTLEFNNPESSVVQHILVAASNASFTAPNTGMGFISETLQLDVTGKLTVASLQKDFDGLLDDLAYIDIAATSGNLVPDAQTMDQLGMFAAISPWIADTENWSFESAAVQVRSLDDELAIDTFTLDAPLMEASGKASFPRGTGTDTAISLEVVDLNNQVRSELAPLAQYMGQTIPEGAFSFDFSWQGTGMPQLSFQPLTK